MLRHPLEYGSIDEYEKANQVDLMDPVDLETFMKVTRDAESEWLEASQRQVNKASKTVEVNVETV